jgi:hypothetical protein
MYIDSCGGTALPTNYVTNDPTGVYVTEYQFIAYRAWGTWVIDHPR